jgi:hypothetical protein
MLKKTVEYTDFNDQRASEEVYFNINEAEILDNLDLATELESLQTMLMGPEHELTPAEIKRIVDLVKRFARLAYGVRSEDGKKFRKGDQIWQDFTDGAVYPEFLMSLFRDPNRAFEFLVAVMPKDLQATARAEVERQGIDMSSLDSDAPAAVTNITNVYEQAHGQLPTPEPVRQATGVAEPTDDELLRMNPLDMTNDQMMRAMQVKNARRMQGE